MEMQNIEPVGALSKALSGPEQQSEPGPDPLAAILARLDALEAAIAAAPAPLSAESVDTPTEAIQRPKRTPAHERAIRRAWRERCERIARADLDRRALLRVNADNRLLLERLHEVEAADRASARIAGEALAEIAQLKASRRRTVKLALAQRKRRQQAEFAAEARAAETVAVSRELDAARWEIERIGAKRRRNALLARKRTREMVAAVNVMHTQVEALTNELDAAKRSPTYFVAETGAEQIDLIGRSAYHAELARERAQTAEHALAAMRARCERAEAARDQLAEAVEGMAGRLARAEAAVRRLEVAA